MDNQVNNQIVDLCQMLQLGELITDPKELTGGLMHRMYEVNTSQGKYAIKALNPQIMLRPTAMMNYIYSERIANVASNYLQAIPAKIINNTFIHKLDQHYFLVFDFIEGKSIKGNEITVDHCEKIGSILAKLHQIDFSILGIADVEEEESQITDWNGYLRQGKENQSSWVNDLHVIINDLYQLEELVNKSNIILSTNRVISHRDLDPKNVMWNEDDPIIIDWEAAGYIHPAKDLIETAIYWSEDSGGSIQKEKFISLIESYKKQFGTSHANWRIVLENGYLGKLRWLEYSFKRSLGIECTDEKEQLLGTQEVIYTIKSIKQYMKYISDIENWLNE